MKRISKKAILPTVIILLCTVLFVAAGAMIYGTEVIAYTYDIGSDQSCEFTWQRENIADISHAGRDIADLTYEWNKGGVFSADSITITINRIAYSGNAIGGTLKIVSNGTTKTGIMPEISSGCYTLEGEVWKETASTTTRLTERLLGYTSVYCAAK